MYCKGMVSIYLVLLIVLCTNANKNDVSSTVRIYHNLAEILQPLGKLPLEFTEEDWQQIRSDSITLLGENLNISLQTITTKKKSLNGTDIYIRSPISSDKMTTKLIKAILIDENNYLVKIRDPSIADENLYFTIPYDQIYYREEPVKSKYYVDFKYRSSDSNVFVSYLRLNLQWQTQYQLHLYENQSDLIAMANIRNDAISSIAIDQAELIGGDIQLQMQMQPFRKSRFGMQPQAQSRISAMQMDFDEVANGPTIEQAKELAGVYVFPINQPFTIDAKTNYLLPMFRPRVTIERYGSISKTFSAVSMTGKAQRSYRLKSDRYLSQGNCIIRELDRIVGESLLPNLAAGDKHEFSIGEDADLVYKEKVTLISSNNFNETDSNAKLLIQKDPSAIVIVTRTRNIYNINLELKNFKTRPVKIEYEQMGLHGYQNVSMTTSSTKYPFIRDGSTIKGNITLKANTTENLSYTLVLIS